MGEVEPEVNAAPEEEQWTGPSQEEWEQTQEVMGMLRDAMQAPPEQAAPQEGQQQLGLDPFSENFSDQLGQFIDSRLAPVNQFSEQVAYGEAEERAMDILTDLQSEHGEFLLPDSAQVARNLANDFVADAQERYGFGPRAAEAALQQAYEHVKAYEQSIGKSYHDQQMNQLSTLGRASAEPSVDGSSVQQVNSIKGSEMDLVRSYFHPAKG